MKEPLKQKAYDYVLGKIIAGELKPGARLSEVSMAKEIGISPTPLREAYRQLASEGFVKHVPNSGIFVRELSEVEIVEFYEAREALEMFCAGKAAGMTNGSDIDELCKCRDKQHDIARELQSSKAETLSSDQELRYMKADALFHLLILKAGGNSIIMKTMRECHIMSRLLGINSHKHTLRQVSTTLRHHSNIIKAIKNRDTRKAEEDMRRHIRFSCKTALENMKGKKSGKSGSHSEDLHNFIYEIEKINEEKL